jgi:zinc protease
MKAVWRYGGMAACVALLAAAPLTAQDSFPAKPPAPTPLSPLTFPAFADTMLANGVNLVVIENHEQPTVALRLSFRGGASYDPAGKEGLAELVAELLTKGTPTRTAEQIAATIEGAGGQLTATSDADFVTIASNVLTDKLDLAVQLLADAARNATFPEAELELARTRYLSNLTALMAQPEALAERAFAREIYGTHPYGRRPTEASYKAITRADVQAFAKSRIQPAGALLVMAGDVTPAQARALVAKHFPRWAGTPAVAAPFPALPVKRAPDILLVHRAGSVQSNITVGNPAMGPRDTNYYAARLATQVLGGGTDSRLFQILREQKGWTYGSFAELRRLRGTGYWDATAEVRTEVTDSALKELLAQIHKIRTEAMPDSELGNAKGFLIGSFPLQIETPEQIAGQVATVKRLGLPATYLETYRERLGAVTPGRARAAAANFFRRAGLTIVVVGDGQKIYEGLNAIAPVRIVTAEGTPLTVDDLTPKGGPLAIDRAQLVTRTDSFRVLVQGNPFGTQVGTLQVTADSAVYTEATDLGGFVKQNTRVVFSPADWSVLEMHQTGVIQGQQLKSDLVYADGRVKGSTMTPQPGGQPKTLAIDTALVAGTLDDNALTVLLPGFALEAGKTLAVSMFTGGQNTTAVLSLKVNAPESVTVPAGTFDAYRVDITGGPQPLTVWVTTAAPRRIVKLAPGGQPVVLELVK